MDSDDIMAGIHGARGMLEPSAGRASNSSPRTFVTVSASRRPAATTEHSRLAATTEHSRGWPRQPRRRRIILGSMKPRSLSVHGVRWRHITSISEPSVSLRDAVLSVTEAGE